MKLVILAESLIPSPVPSDQGSPSSVALEVLVVSDTLLVIPSIQPINSRAPDDEAYEFHWNPIWEPYKDDIPFTRSGVSTPMSTSHMDETSPRASDTPVLSSIETPIPATSPVPSCYKSLRDNAGTRIPASSTMWDLRITPTMGSFVSQVHSTPVTSVPTNPTICVAHSTPVVSAVTASSAVTTRCWSA